AWNVNHANAVDRLRRLTRRQRRRDDRHVMAARGDSPRQCSCVVLHSASGVRRKNTRKDTKPHASSALPRENDPVQRVALVRKHRVDRVERQLNSATSQHTERLCQLRIAKPSVPERTETLTDRRKRSRGRFYAEDVEGGLLEE